MEMKDFQKCVGLNLTFVQLSLIKIDFFSVPVFQVVRFPNDPCIVDEGSKNGTCYTA